MVKLKFDKLALLETEIDDYSSQYIVDSILFQRGIKDWPSDGQTLLCKQERVMDRTGNPSESSSGA